MHKPEPAAQLEEFIERFDPAIATVARASLRTLTARLPYATRLVYDNYNALAIGFCPGMRASEVVLSIAIYPKRVLLCFLFAGKRTLDDPHALLRGSGATNRFIPMATAKALDDPRIEALITQAERTAPVPFDTSVKGPLVIKSISVKQRPRRSGA